MSEYSEPLSGMIRISSTHATMGAARGLVGSAPALSLPLMTFLDKMGRGSLCPKHRSSFSPSRGFKQENFFKQALRNAGATQAVLGSLLFLVDPSTWLANGWRLEREYLVHGIACEISAASRLTSPGA
jgi:hypothetical protein